MRTLKKAAALLATGVCLTSSLTGCSKVVDEIVTSMVKWDLDSNYLNEHNETYLKLVGSTKEESEKLYYEGIAFDVENFCYYWGIIDGEAVTVTDLEQDLQDRLTNLCDSISKKANYDVQSATIQDGGSYSVKVVVKPIDIMEQANTLYMEETYEPLNVFWEETADVDYEAISDEEYLALCNEYGYIMVEMVEGLLPNLGYMEEKSMIIQLQEKDDMWEFNEDDLGNFYDKVVYYPYE